MTHHLIYFLAEGRNEKDATESVEELLNHMVGEGMVYDWATLFTEDTANSGFGIGLWGRLPIAALVTSKEGQDMIEKAMKTQKEIMKEHFEEFKKGLNANPDILNDYEKLSELIYYSYNVGSIYNIPLFNMFGDPIFTEDDLKNILNMKLEKDFKLFVVPVDAHT